MLLLNISDIHFRHPECTTHMDPDRVYRTRLIQDARAMSAKLGPADAVLVGGDIAYKGNSDEYSVALEWLKELCEACGCPLEKVFMVPGNHDVDRKVINGSTSVRNVQAAIRNSSSREKELRDQFGDAQTGRSLFAPIEAYNAFAAQFNCQIYSPDKLFWRHDFQLDNRTILRIHGLTSTILSGANGVDDQAGNLYLSPLQTVLDPIEGIVNLVMCHHPPNWLLDHDEVEDAVTARAAVQFFGHRHRQRVHCDTSYIRFSSAAVNPDRREVGWEPGYNFVRLTTSEQGTTRFLNVEAHLRVWQTSPDMFRAKMASADEDVFRHAIKIYGTVRVRAVNTGDVVADDKAQSELQHPPQPPRDLPALEATMSEDKTRNLVLRFWQLASSERREIALTLALLEDEEILLPEPERYGRALARAGERNLLEQMAEEIEKRERHGC